MPKRTAAFLPFSLRGPQGDWYTYRCVLISCGKPYCLNDRHGPYMYARYRGLDGKWKEKYIGALDDFNAQAVIRQIAREQPYYRPYLIEIGEENMTNKKEIAAVKKLWQAGKNIWEISQILGIPETRVTEIVRKL